MATERLMGMPPSAGTPAQPTNRGPRPTVTSADSYDAALTALDRIRPGESTALKDVIRKSLADIEPSPQELAEMISVIERISQNPGGYKAARQELIQNGYMDEEDLPEEYDAEFLGAVLAVLNEMQLMRGEGAMEPLAMSPAVGKLPPMQLAQGGLADVSSYLASQGRNGDTMLAHITPDEARLLKSRGGSGTINPVTGLPEFFLKKLFKSIGKAIKGFFKSPIGRILGTVAIATLLGPTAIGMSLGSAGTAAVASGASTLLGGGSVKEALVSGAMGYLGGGGTVMGVNPISTVGDFLPGATGGTLNTALATGAIGAGIGKLSGMSTSDALRMGLSSGASTAALQGLRGPAATSGGIAPGGIESIPTTAELQLPPGAAPEPNFSVAQGPAAPSPLQLPPGAAPEPGYTVAGDKPGLFDQATTGAKNLYNEYLSPSRPGLPEDATLLRKYGPLALTGLGATALMGSGAPAEANPLFKSTYTGLDYMRDNPALFAAGLDRGYVKPVTPINPVVAPAPRLYAHGGDARPAHFPRRNGPIAGPGTGTSDDIPAMLSDGEFVFTARAVRNAGNGSRRKGAARMYKLMKMLEGGPVKGK